MRYRARSVDGNQSEIVAALRKAGCSVVDLSAVGKGCPDLLVGKHGKTLLIEVKQAKGKLTPDQIEFADTWVGGPVHVARSLDEALAAIFKK